jgi:hypothetical protein
VEVLDGSAGVRPVGSFKVGNYATVDMEMSEVLTEVSMSLGYFKKGGY